MSKENVKKLTLQDLITRKTQREKDILRVQEVYIEELEGTIEIRRPNEDIIMETMDMIQSESVKDVVNAYDFLIYNSAPILKSKELHEAYECVEPMDIVKELLSLNDRLGIGSKVMEMAGFKDYENKVKKQ